MTTPAPAPPIRVLFVCTGNSARSQMAEAVLRHLGGPDFQVHSAGTEPKDVHPMTVLVLREIGIDWSGARSKSVRDFLDEPFDHVITVCDSARQVCPVFPGKHAGHHWGLEDPAAAGGTEEERLAIFRRILGQISLRMKPFAEAARRDAGLPAAPPRVTGR